LNLFQCVYLSDANGIPRDQTDLWKELRDKTEEITDLKRQVDVLKFEKNSAEDEANRMVRDQQDIINDLRRQLKHLNDKLADSEQIIRDQSAELEQLKGTDPFFFFCNRIFTW